MMNQDDCMKLAEEYGTPTSNKWHENCVTFNPNQLAAFCQAHADKVRKECAKAVEAIYTHQLIETKYAGLVASVQMDCAAAIRAKIGGE